MKFHISSVFNFLFYYYYFFMNVLYNLIVCYSFAQLCHFFGIHAELMNEYIHSVLQITPE